MKKVIKEIPNSVLEEAFKKGYYNFEKSMEGEGNDHYDQYCLDLIKKYDNKFTPSYHTIFCGQTIDETLCESFHKIIPYLKKKYKLKDYTELETVFYLMIIDFFRQYFCDVDKLIAKYADDESFFKNNILIANYCVEGLGSDLFNKKNQLDLSTLVSLNDYCGITEFFIDVCAGLIINIESRNLKKFLNLIKKYKPDWKFISKNFNDYYGSFTYFDDFY